jgi:hypothetical protein
MFEPACFRHVNNTVNFKLEWVSCRSPYKFGGHRHDKPRNTEFGSVQSGGASTSFLRPVFGEYISHVTQHLLLSSTPISDLVSKKSIDDLRSPALCALNLYLVKTICDVNPGTMWMFSSSAEVLRASRLLFVFLELSIRQQCLTLANTAMRHHDMFTCCPLGITRIHASIAKQLDQSFRPATTRSHSST